MTDYTRAVAYLHARGFLVTPELLREAFEGPPVEAGAHDALHFAELDWRSHVGEHDRAPGSGLDRIFKAAGWGGVPKGADDKIPEWCGMAVVSWLLRAGLNPAFNTSFLHCLNVEAFFTYGARKNVNPARLDTEVVFGAERKKIDAWHRSEGKPRLWTLLSALGPDVKPSFAPDDVMLLDWSGRRTEADHITLVRSWDGRMLTTFEGNRTGQGPGGEKWREAVVTCSYDLHDPKVLALIYGVGRCSALDFQPAQVR